MRERRAAAARSDSGPQWVAVTLDWQDKAGCRDSDPETFFDSRRQAEALKVCRYCPVITECRAFADAAESASTSQGRIFGIYGGETPGQRITRRTATQPSQ